MSDANAFSAFRTAMVQDSPNVNSASPQTQASSSLLLEPPTPNPAGNLSCLLETDDPDSDILNAIHQVVQETASDNGDANTNTSQPDGANPILGAQIMAAFANADPGNAEVSTDGSAGGDESKEPSASSQPVAKRVHSSGLTKPTPATAKTITDEAGNTLEIKIGYPAGIRPGGKTSRGPPSTSGVSTSTSGSTTPGKPVDLPQSTGTSTSLVQPPKLLPVQAPAPQQATAQQQQAQMQMAQQQQQQQHAAFQHAAMQQQVQMQMQMQAQQQAVAQAQAGAGGQMYYQPMMSPNGQMVPMQNPAAQAQAQAQALAQAQQQQQMMMMMPQAQATAQPGQQMMYVPGAQAQAQGQMYAMPTPQGPQYYMAAPGAQAQPAMMPAQQMMMPQAQTAPAGMVAMMTAQGQMVYMPAQ